MRLWSQLLGAPDPTAQDRYVDNWLRGLDIGYSSATGLTVTTADAQTIPGVSACIQTLSEDLAKVPIAVYQKMDDGTRRRATEHPLFNLLKFGPAPWLSSFAWRRAMLHNALGYGNGYSRVWRTERGALDKITLIQTGRTLVKWTTEGEPFFDVSSQTGIDTNLSWQDVIHVPYRGSTDRAWSGGVLGVSPIDQNRETIALALAAERFAASFFKNGARPSAVLEFDRALPNDEVAKRIREGIERTYAGADNAFKIAILELGMKLKEFSYNNVDSQLTETRKLQANLICMLYGVPPHKVGILDRATFSNIEHQSIDYVTGPVSSLAECLQSAIEVSCLTPEERAAGYYVELNLDGLMRGDIQSRYRAYAIGRQWGWLNADEIRAWENQDVIPGGAGEDYLTPLNMAPAGTDPSQDVPTQNPEPPGNNPAPNNPAGKLSGSAHLAARISTLVGPSGETLYH